MASKVRPRRMSPEARAARLLEMSDRHRLYGWDCPVEDLDFLEYDHGRAVALVEYKHEKAAPIDLGHPSVRALENLGTRAGVPVFVVKHAADFSWFNCLGINKLARERLGAIERWTEAEWVALLYEIRGRTVPSEILEKLRPC